jgi:NADPH-dependent glutamate synthase beta subunit-like oxidoreductase/ferredoxin
MTTTLLPPTAWTTSSTEAIKTGTWRASMPHYIKPPSPCHQACPVNGDIAEWIGLARERDFRGAWEVLTRHNPFPAVAGRICHHPCEAACNRGDYDESLAICKLERAIGDMAIEQGWRFDYPAVEHPRKVAIVGGGPSGLSAAFQLRRQGWGVTIYESQAQLGGLMRYGIPSYRLSREVLDCEITRIVGLGVQVRCEQAISSAADFQRLRETHDAVYLAIGAGRPKRLPQLPEGAPWWMHGAEYLAQANTGTPPALGRRLLVIGGGSAALDVARSARRAGHEVTLLALEQAQQMPAQREEVAEALEEGIALVDGAMLTGVAPRNGEGLALTCVRVQLEFGAVRGQFKVRPVAGSEFTLATDAIVSSIGQDPELAALASLFPVEGNLLTVDARQSAADGVWAGGDMASMARFVTEAIGMGKRAALDIHRRLRNDSTAPAGEQALPVNLSNIATFYHPKQARAAETRRSARERLASGIEVQLGLEFEQALAEAGRCFSCGNCTACDNCFHYCPDLAVKRVEGGGYTVLADYCKGCGICVRECPTGSMTMREEIR